MGLQGAYGGLGFGVRNPGFKKDALILLGDQFLRPLPRTLR